jgi:hypothetical protein
MKALCINEDADNAVIKGKFYNVLDDYDINYIQIKKDNGIKRLVQKKYFILNSYKGIKSYINPLSEVIKSFNDLEGNKDICESINNHLSEILKEVQKLKHNPQYEGMVQCPCCKEWVYKIFSSNVCYDCWSEKIN